MKRSPWYVLFVLAASMSAQAQDDTRQPLWEVGVIAGGVSTPAYPGAAERSNRALALPFIIYRGKVFRSDQSGINARLLKSDLLELDVGFAASLPSRSEAGAARAGMPDLGTLLEAGPRLKVNLVRPTPFSRVRLDFPLRAVVEAKGGVHHQGWTFEPKLVYDWRDASARWTGDAYVGAVWGDRQINGYFYDVAPRYATLNRPAYAADSGLMLTRVGLSGSRKLNEDLRVFGFVRSETYSGSANRASPLMKRNTGSSAGIGLAWTLRRSERRAAD
jgi:outer membrane scaffolding protein for murein synthesis (MipA/OmpV family)